MWLVYLPSSLYYVWLAMKARTFLFFSTSNPSIFSGGMLFESKIKVYELIPKNYFPTTLYVKDKENLSFIIEHMKATAIQFPCIAKPDKGGRGWAVRVLRNEEDLAQYQKKINNEFLIQQLIDYPVEYSVFYYRLPNSIRGRVIGLTRKELLTLTGDGTSNVLELIKKNTRAYLQLKSLVNNQDIDFKKVLERNETYTIVPFGNHSRGAMFINESHLINQQLHETFDAISKQIDGFFFGRYDLKCTSEKDLIIGKNISIVELNGAGAEPAHIYDPNFSYFEAQKVLRNHFKTMYDISRMNHTSGISYMTFIEYLTTKVEQRRYQKRARL